MGAPRSLLRAGAGAAVEVPRSLLAGRPLLGAGAIACGALGALGALGAVLRHARAYSAPVPQRACIRILLLSPLLVVTSIVGLACPPATVYCEAVRGGYEAFVLYNFVALMLHYVGGPVDLVEQWRATGGTTLPACCGGGHVRLDRAFLSRIVQAVLQYVFVRAALVVVVPVLEALGKFGEGRVRWESGAPTAWLFIMVVQNLSLSLALTGLWMLSKSSRHLMEEHQVPPPPHPPSCLSPARSWTLSPPNPLAAASFSRTDGGGRVRGAAAPEICRHQVGPIRDLLAGCGNDSLVCLRRATPRPGGQRPGGRPHARTFPPSHRESAAVDRPRLLFRSTAAIPADWPAGDGRGVPACCGRGSQCGGQPTRSPRLRKVLTAAARRHPASEGTQVFGRARGARHALHQHPLRYFSRHRPQRRRLPRAGLLQLHLRPECLPRLRAGGARRARRRYAPGGQLPRCGEVPRRGGVPSRGPRRREGQ